ncbi:Cof-type HAD-IIB family hydrolase [Deinococcus peraridilitoris]|uniref:HAD-superfamily hydrolase, subfamily IIB n=1 Tax=Deinococcus peraridilitoris (strain DSM 19664 / LMG 22246 / CIP 109416 / KR-200) TaxID=937777 RepID=L0A5H0_DEIPD|nr:Cof-type HAD-IIB family hydrolase [Deinococcus peraridilitoris]AFZ69123.1 HAD-superfamily hydrolase, subfamily IIB [Deinococcus peraridilitoris DSM 19664]
MLGLVCIDVDGTLVGSSGDVLPEVWAAAARAREAGIRLAICSGRPAFGKARGYAERLDPDGWHIFQNGASIVNTRSLTSRSSPLPMRAVAALIERSRRLGRILELYTDSAYAVENTARRAREHAALLGLPFEPRDLLSLQGQVVRAQWVVPIEETDEVLSEDHRGMTLSPAGSPVMPDTMFISLTTEGIDKASALRSVAASYGVPIERTMMIGDGPNDAQAMRAAGYAVAMGNAEAEALESARVVVSHVDEGGLAEALELALTID